MEKQNQAIASLKRRVAFRMKGFMGLCFHNWKTNFFHYVRHQREVSPPPCSSHLVLVGPGALCEGVSRGGREAEALDETSSDATRPPSAAIRTLQCHIWGLQPPVIPPDLGPSCQASQKARFELKLKDSALKNMTQVLWRQLGKEASFRVGLWRDRLIESRWTEKILAQEIQFLGMRGDECENQASLARGNVV